MYIYGSALLACIAHKQTEMDQFKSRRQPTLQPWTLYSREKKGGHNEGTAYTHLSTISSSAWAKHGQYNSPSVNRHENRKPPNSHQAAAYLNSQLGQGERVSFANVTRLEGIPFLQQAQQHRAGRCWSSAGQRLAIVWPWISCRRRKSRPHFQVGSAQHRGWEHDSTNKILYVRSRLRAWTTITSWFELYLRSSQGNSKFTELFAVTGPYVVQVIVHRTSYRSMKSDTWMCYLVQFPNIYRKSYYLCGSAAFMCLRCVSVRFLENNRNATVHLFKNRICYGLVRCGFQIKISKILLWGSEPWLVKMKVDTLCTLFEASIFSRNSLALTCDVFLEIEEEYS